MLQALVRCYGVHRSGIQAQARLSYGEDTPQGTLCPSHVSMEALYARPLPQLQCWKGSQAVQPARLKGLCL